MGWVSHVDLMTWHRVSRSGDAERTAAASARTRPCRPGRLLAIGEVLVPGGRPTGWFDAAGYVGDDASATALMAASEAARGRGLDGQDGVQPGDRQHVACQLPRPVQDQPTVDGPLLLINQVEHCQPGGTEELQPGHVKHDFRVTVPAQLIEYLLQMGGAGQIKLSTQTHPAALAIRADLHPEARSILPTNRTTPQIVTHHRPPGLG